MLYGPENADASLNICKLEFFGFTRMLSSFHGTEQISPHEIHEEAHSLCRHKMLILRNQEHKDFEFLVIYEYHIRFLHKDPPKSPYILHTGPLKPACH